MEIKLHSWWKNKANGEVAELVSRFRGSVTLRFPEPGYVGVWVSLGRLREAWEPVDGIPTRAEAAELFNEAARYCKGQTWAVRLSFDENNGECSKDAIPWLSKRLRDNFAVGLAALDCAPYVLEGYLRAAAFEMSLSDPF